MPAGLTEGTVIYPPSNDKGITDIGHSINMALDTRKSVFWESTVVTVSSLVQICDRYYKMRQLFS